jgi:hypothetical protein
VTKKRAVESRAISYDKVMSLAGLNLGNWCGIKAGWEAVINANGGGQQGLQAAHATYHDDKATRDSMRSIAVSLFMTDFDVAWQSRGREKPKKDELQFMASKYRTAKFDTLEPEERKQITLAHFEIDAIETAKIIYEVFTGKQVDLPNFTPQDLLKKVWPPLAEQMEERDKGIKFVDLLQAQLIAEYNQAGKYDEERKDLESLIGLYASSVLALKEMPASIALTHTKRAQSPAQSEMTDIDDEEQNVVEVRQISTNVDDDFVANLCPFGDHIIRSPKASPRGAASGTLMTQEQKQERKQTFSPFV